MRVPRAVWAIPVLVVVVVGVGVVAAWEVMNYTASPGFCATCHLMQTRYVSWQRSPHWEKATCIECHSEPGRLGELKAHLSGTRYLYVMLTGEKTGPILRASVGSATCAQCHPANALREGTATHPPFHGRHLRRGVECAACHAGLVHGSLYGRQARPSMETCVDCHERQGPIMVACRTCHVQPVRGTLARLAR